MLQDFQTDENNVELKVKKTPKTKLSGTVKPWYLKLNGAEKKIEHICKRYM